MLISIQLNSIQGEEKEKKDLHANGTIMTAA